MSSSLFFAAAVVAGFVLIALVVYSYVRPQPEHKPSVTALLGLLGFVLVASPNWTSISIKSEGLELSLLREMQARQLEVLTELQSRTGGAEPARAPSSPAPARRTLREPRPAGEPAGGEGSPATSPPSPIQPRASAGTAPAPQDRKSLIEAFDRGELDLRSLSNAELLALNARLNEQAKTRRR